MLELFFDFDFLRTSKESYRRAPTVDAILSLALLAAGLTSGYDWLKAGWTAGEAKEVP